ARPTSREAGRAASSAEPTVPREEVYRPVGVPELKANEERFLFAGAEAPRAIILAAGFEPQLLPLTQDRPKAMLEVKGRTILERQIEALGRVGIRDVVVVRGYKKENVVAPGARLCANDRFAETGEVRSLLCAGTALSGPCVILYGDIIFEPPVLEKLVRSPADLAVVVDRAFVDTLHAGLPLPPGPLDLVVTETPANGRRFVAPEGGSRVLRIGPEVLPGEAHGEFIGLAMLSGAGVKTLREVHAELVAQRGEGLGRGSITQTLPA